MNIEEMMPAVLNSLCEKRVWESATPDNLPRDKHGEFLPFILWNIVGGQDSEYVDQTAPDAEHYRIQLHVVAPGAIAARDLSRAARDALLASPYTVGVLGSAVGTYDAPRKLRGRRQQFSIWLRQSA